MGAGPSAPEAGGGDDGDAEDLDGSQDIQEFRRYRRERDRALRDGIVERYMPFARYLARRFRGRGQAPEDLEQVAMVGLLKAVERFDPERGLAFRAFATPTILGELKRHFRDTSWAVRVPRRLQEHVLHVSSTVGALGQARGRMPTVPEVARECGLTEEQVLEALEANSAFRADPLDAPAGGAGSESGATLGALLGEEDPGHHNAENRVLVEELLRDVPERERTILELRFWGGQSQSQIADQLGISQMHVSRLLARTLLRLRSSIAPIDVE